MSKLFLGNFEFEYALADPRRILPAKLLRIRAELASSWLAIANDNDYLWTPKAIDPFFFERASAEGLPRVRPVSSFDEVPGDVECLPWGWTEDIRRLCVARGWQHHQPPLAAVRQANSRRISALLEREFDVGLPGAMTATTITEIEHQIASLSQVDRWVVKAEFGMSARERVLGCGSTITAAARTWIARRLATDGVVFFEPWVERIDEVGIQMEIPSVGTPQWIETVPMLVDGRGQYSGSVFASTGSRRSSPLSSHVPRFGSEVGLVRPCDNLGEQHALNSEVQWNLPRRGGGQSPSFAQQAGITPGLSNDWQSAVQIALRTAFRLQEMGYFGPVGIDAMRYRTADGKIQLRPIQDINARWTMGRLSLGFRRLLRPGETGRWHHGPRNSLTPQEGPSARWIRSSPDAVGDTLAHHFSHVLIQNELLI